MQLDSRPMVTVRTTAKCSPIPQGCCRRRRWDHGDCYELSWISWICTEFSISSQVPVDEDWWMPHEYRYTIQLPWIFLLFGMYQNHYNPLTIWGKASDSGIFRWVLQRPLSALLPPTEVAIGPNWQPVTAAASLQDMFGVDATSSTYVASGPRNKDHLFRFDGLSSLASPFQTVTILLSFIRFHKSYKSLSVECFSDPKRKP